MDQILLVKKKALRWGEKEVRGGDEESERGGGKEKAQAGEGNDWEVRYISKEEFRAVETDQEGCWWWKSFTTEDWHICGYFFGSRWVGVARNA